MKVFFGVLGALIATVLIVLGLAFAMGFGGNLLDATVGKQSMNIQRTNYEQSQSYVEGQIQTLAKEKQEYDLAKSDSDRQAILNYVNDSFGSFNANDITDPTLYNFLLKARGE